MRITGPSHLVITFFSCSAKAPLITEKSAPVSISAVTPRPSISTSRSETLDLELDVSLGVESRLLRVLQVRLGRAVELTAKCRRSGRGVSVGAPSSCGMVSGGSSSIRRQATSPPKAALLSFPYEGSGTFLALPPRFHGLAMCSGCMAVMVTVMDWWADTRHGASSLQLHVVAVRVAVVVR